MPDQIPSVRPLVGDARLRSAGFEIAYHDRHNVRLWTMHRGTRMFTEDEALAVIDKLTAAGYVRDGSGLWTMEGLVGTSWTLPQALANVERIERGIQ